MTKPADIKLVAVDLDGTFLRDDKTISPANLRAVEELRRRGIEFTFCTGRIASQTYVYSRQLDQRKPVATSQGSVIFDPVEGRVISSADMDRIEAQAIIGFCCEKGYDYVVLTHGPVFCAPGSRRLRNYRLNNDLAAKAGVPQMDVRIMDREELPRELSVSKMLITDDDPGRLSEAMAMLERLPNTGYVMSDAGLLDVCRKGENKGLGILRLAVAYGVRPGEVCAFGDYDNDVDMFRAAGMSVAMGNAPAWVREQADFVTDSNQEDGFAEAVSRLLLT